MNQSPMRVEIKELTEKTLKQLLAKMPTLGKVVGEGEFEVIATTDSIDRDGEILLADGWDFTNYKKNPIVLWGHDWYSKPIGAVTEIKQEDGIVTMRGFFAPTEAGQEVRKLYDAGILRTVSVGCFVKESNGPVKTKMEMVELSFVAIPANTEAMNPEHMKAMEKIAKTLEKEVKTNGEEETKQEFKNSDKAQKVTVTIDLPKSTDSTKTQAKEGLEKSGRVLSAKNISAMEELVTMVGTFESGLASLKGMLRNIIDSANTDKSVEREREKEALQLSIATKVRLSSKILDDANRESKILRTL